MGPVRVLIADDHAPTREDIVSALREDGGFTVIAQAEDAPGAVDAALREQPQLALSTAQIARTLVVSPATVRSHVAAILRTPRVPDRDAAVRLLDRDTE